MQLVRGKQTPLPWVASHAGCVATLGNMDGVHQGHRALLRETVMQARLRRLPSVVIVFEPHPAEFFAANQQTTHPLKARLTRLTEKLTLLQACRIDYVWCLRFDTAFSQCTAQAFLAQWLVGQAHIRHLVVGRDCRFGRDRLGDNALLQWGAAHYGYGLSVLPPCLVQGERISSTAVRDALQQGNMLQVSALLGQPYSLMGRVCHGDKRGRQWGFPTANLPFKRTILPAQGVFAVRVAGLAAWDTPQAVVAYSYAAQWGWPGVASLGYRPTVGGKRPWIEVFLFGFNSNIYGYRLRVFLLHKLREEKHFPSIETLIQQMHDDVDQAKAYFMQGHT